MSDEGATSASIALAVIGIAAACLYGCVQSNTSYYEAQAKCVQAGGSWVPLSGGPNNAACIAGNRTQPLAATPPSPAPQVRP